MDLNPWASAVSIATDIAAGRVGSRDLLECYLDRCAQSMLGAVVTVDADGARATADACDRAVSQGAALGPLHGVPMTVKDAWAVRGMRGTSGMAELADDVPEVDAVVVARLRAAGAVLFGKTNVPPGITGQETANSLFGRTVNPWDPARTCGGSSGGAAAALAAGLTALEVGSDSGGSIRQPAHCCGVFGHVPTHGLVPLRGHRPQVPLDRPGKDIDLMTAGPLARSAADLATALDVLAGEDPLIAGGQQVVLPASSVTSLSQARIAVWLDDACCPTDQAVLDRLQAAADAVAGAGGTVIQARPSFTLEEVWELAFTLWVASASSRTSDEEMGRLTLQRNASGLVGRRARAETMDHRDWLRADDARRDLQRQWIELLADVDVLLCPVIPVTAPPHDPSPSPEDVASVDRRLERTIEVNGEPRPYLDQLTWNIAVGLAGLPATVAPVGLAADGLPVGVQVVGGRYRDRTSIAVAGLLCAAVGWDPTQPPFP